LLIAVCDRADAQGEHASPYLEDLFFASVADHQSYPCSSDLQDEEVLREQEGLDVVAQSAAMPRFAKFDVSGLRLFGV
jgi:hypothetical protein